MVKLKSENYKGFEIKFEKNGSLIRAHIFNKNGDVADFFDRPTKSDCMDVAKHLINRFIERQESGEIPF